MSYNILLVFSFQMVKLGWYTYIMYVCMYVCMYVYAPHSMIAQVHIVLAVGIQARAGPYRLMNI